MGPIWFLRMARWVRQSPAPSRVLLTIVVLVACLIIAAAQYYGFWPDWATLQVRRHLPKF